MKRQDWQEVGHLEEEAANITHLAESIAQPFIERDAQREAFFERVAVREARVQSEMEKARTEHLRQNIFLPVETDEWGIYAREDKDRAHVLVFTLIAVAAAVIGFTFGWWLWG